MKVDLIDIGIGNTKSVRNWLESLNCDVKSVCSKGDISAELVVLPGVGSAKPFMEKIKTTGFDEKLTRHVATGKRLLGICLGYQVLFSHSEEDGGVDCLGIFDGTVERLEGKPTHNGWESLSLDLRKINFKPYWRKNKLTKQQLFNGRFFYNHEYGVVSNNNQLNIPISEEMPRYSAITIRENVIGMQFHPEKSQISGLQLLKYIL